MLRVAANLHADYKNRAKEDTKGTLKRKKKGRRPEKRPQEGILGVGARKL